MYWNRVVVLSCTVIFSAEITAQRTTIKDGVYTAQQASRGQALYRGQCASCHGDDLTGTTEAPALTGADFLGAWDQLSVADLVDKIQTSMPARTPGSLSRKDAADLVAYTLQVGQLPKGEAELGEDADSLRSLVIVK